MIQEWIPNTPFGAWACGHLLEYSPFRRSGLTVADAEREIERLAGEDSCDVHDSSLYTDGVQAEFVNNLLAQRSFDFRALAELRRGGSY